MLLCFFHHMAGVFVLGDVLGDVSAKELEVADSLYSRPVDGDEVQPLSFPPVVHDQLLGLIDVESQVVFLAP